MKYVTRLAPSPTGMMHIGTARTGLFCWLAAKASGGKFILRLDDTDADRNIQEAIQPIFDGLEWLGLVHDEFFRQSDRKEIYREHAHNLLQLGLASRLDNGAIALRFPDGMPRMWHDEIAGDIPITDTNKEQIDGKTILLRGGDKLEQPTYQFASVVDDYFTDVNFIIRGTDHITNTAKQLAIWHALQLYAHSIGQAPKPVPQFAHVGLIFKDKKKMSKRDGAASLLDYRDKGYHPDAIFNFLMRLGWGPKVDNKENSILSRDRAIQMFLTEGKMNSRNANFDPVKLDWNDRVYKKMKAA